MGDCGGGLQGQERGKEIILKGEEDGSMLHTYI
jgi:hypothetical protein